MVRGFGSAVHLTSVSVALVFFISCTGSIDNGSGSAGGDGAGANAESDGKGSGKGNGSGSSGPAAAAAFKCDAASVPKATPLRRLTTSQYRNTIRDLLTYALKDASQAKVVMADGAVAAAMSTISEDQQLRLPNDKYGSFRRLSQSVEQKLVAATYDVAVAVAAQLTTSQRLPVLVGNCASDSDAANDAQCLDDFIARFGMRAWRRPLRADDIKMMKTFYGTAPKADALAYADLVTGMLTSPHFLYQVEHGSNDLEQGRPNYYRLDDFELASRLSYQFLQSMPDAALFEAAQSGALRKDANKYASELERLLKTDAAKLTIDEFFYDQLKLFPSEIRNLDTLDSRNQDIGFKKFAGPDMPSSTLGKEMRDEIIAMGRYFTWDEPGSFGDMLNTDLSFATSAEVAKLYGVGAWSGTGAPPRLPAGERPGFLTRAAFLTTGLVTTRPIIKGVFIREHVLCDGVPPPPQGAGNTPIDRTNKTTREAVEDTTEQDGTGCVGCHRNLLNPLGFVTESFDSLGRKRTEERLFQENGTEYGKKPVNTKAIPQVTEGDLTEVSSPSELVNLIAESGKAEACFARGYFRFTFQRWDDIGHGDEDASADACLVERIRQKARTGTLVDAFKEVALAPEFKTRLFE